jgi:isoleucyl-tRNA synthetase
VLSEGLPIVEADYVTADSGTGLVHSAPAHGMEDYVTWKAQDSMTGSLSSPIASFVDADGQYSAALSSTILEPDVDHLIGASVLEDAPQKIMADLHPEYTSVVCRCRGHQESSSRGTTSCQFCS